MGNLIDEVYENIRRALEVLNGIVHKTPIDFSSTFSRMTENKIYFKLENLQKTGSFKVRGAYYKLYINKEKLEGRGVVAASSGNHAQGVAFASSILKVPSIIVMPETTPVFKVNATKSYGATVVLYGKVYDDAYKKAMEIVSEKGYMFIHPFNDVEIMGGQGTIGIELLNQLNDIDAVVVPIGGGGLISGIGVAIKKLRPSIKIIGVEPKAAPKYYYSRQSGKIESVEPSPSLADGVVTKSVGDKTFEIMQEVVDDVVVVEEDAISRAVYLMMERSKIVAEGAGALPLAAMLDGKIPLKDKRIILVVSGGNIDLTTVQRIIMKGLSADGRIAELSLMLRDSPGELEKVLSVISKYRCNVLEVKHDRFGLMIPVGYAKVDILIEIPNREVIALIKNELKHFLVNMSV